MTILNRRNYPSCLCRLPSLREIPLCKKTNIFTSHVSKSEISHDRSPERFIIAHEARFDHGDRHFPSVKWMQGTWDGTWQYQSADKFIEKGSWDENYESDV